ncbi:MAG: hypothetical protein ACLFRT_14240 [Actinomycetota bacterium]
MRQNRLICVTAVIAFVVVGCTIGANDPTTTTTTTAPTTTTTDPPMTTTFTTTTTTPAITTNTTEDDPWTVDYPLEAGTVDDLPSVLTDTIGAEEPDPDLSIEGPDDIDRWVEEWLNWFSWVNANPEAGIEALEHGVIPTSAFYEETVAALESRQEEGNRLLGYAFVPHGVTGTFDEFFERHELLRLVVVASDTIPRYVVDQDGSVVTIHEPLGGETDLLISLRLREGEQEWVLENIEVAG